jgi:F5/8 type C domain
VVFERPVLIFFVLLTASLGLIWQPFANATNVTVPDANATNVTVPDANATNVTVPDANATNVTAPAITRPETVFSTPANATANAANVTAPFPVDPCLYTVLCPRAIVKFNSITIYDDHDHFGVLPRTCCSGEWTLHAYVQGLGVTLMQYKEDIDDGDTFTFPPEAQVIAVVNPQKALSVLTIGSEDDTNFFESCFWYGIPVTCGFCALGPAAAHNAGIVQILKGAVPTWKDSLHQYQDYYSGGCDGDKLGFINAIYDIGRPGEAWTFNRVSESGDFKLTYTVTWLEDGTGATTGPCSTAPIQTNGVRSSAYQPTYPATNAIDNNLATKWWSTLTTRPYITLDIANPNKVCSVDIAWADGNTRAYKFVVSASNTGTNFVPIGTWVSGRTTTGFEQYVFPETVNARFIKVTITESTSGSTSSIAQISELRTQGTVGP